MKLGMKCISTAVLLAFLAGSPGHVGATVMMNGSIQQTSGFGLNILETANFTIDDWLSNPNLWWLTVDNAKMSPTDTLSVIRADIKVKISSPQYQIIDGVLHLISTQGRSAYRKTPLEAGGKIIISNTVVSSGSDFIDGSWSTKFKDEVIRIGSLPEGVYTMTFTLTGEYSDHTSFDGKVDIIDGVIEIKNPLPPELVTPDNQADNVVSVPRFAWQAPQVTDITVKSIKKSISVNYTVTLWKMFTETGAVLTQEEAIRRIPIWVKKNVTLPTTVFDPGTAREELVPGRKYCWQVQAFDGSGRFVSPKNEGKSDIWEFSVKFVPASLNEPILFAPLRFSWTAAQAGGAMIRYNVSVAESQDFARAFTQKGLLLTNFTYPSDAPVLVPGRVYYLRIQATDDKGIAIGSPTVFSFSPPTFEVNLLSPDDGAALSTLKPTFKWQGTAKSYVVTITQDGARWSATSGKIDRDSWTYDGEDLKRGVTYSWLVAPSNERGDPAGPPSAARKFVVPDNTQITLSSPVNLILDTVFPVFTWNGLPGSDSQVSYIIEITTEAGAAVHTATVAATTFTYPKNAPALSYGAKFLWSVRAQRGGADIGQRSGQAWFVTPFVQAGTGEPTLADIGAAVKQVLADYPQFTPFKNMSVTSIRDQSGPITSAQFLELLDKFRISSVSAK